MPKPRLAVIAVAFLVAVALFVVSACAASHSFYSTGDVLFDGHPPTEAEVWDAVRSSGVEAIGPGVLYSGLLLGAAWACSWLFRRVPVPAALLAGFMVGMACGGVLWAVTWVATGGWGAAHPIAVVASGAILFATVGGAMPRRRSA